jgi:Ni2+-binding GTPase involved in maturation of urease and hydrogenase
MKIIMVAGLPCAGKTLLIAHLIRSFMSLGIKAAAAKFDILSAEDYMLYDSKIETASMKNFCNFICPGFHSLSTLNDVVKWGMLKKVEILFVETAIFCCSGVPRFKDIPIIMVIDNLRGMYSQDKMHCLLSFADIAVITKTDLVCSAETEMFRSKIRLVQPNAPIIIFNGLNGKGASTLACIIAEFEDTDKIKEKKLCCSST